MKIDVTTIGGLTLGTGMVLMGMVLASGGDINLFIAMFINQPDSAAITVGGSFGGTMATFPLYKFKKIFTVFARSAVTDPANTAHVELINEMVEYATEARRNGVLALDAKTEEIQDPFIKNGIQLAVDGTAPEQIEEIMTLEIDAIKKRHEDNQGMILKWAELAPAYGMIGTLVGLIAMLANLADPDAIGPSMAVALVTTMYGSMVANMFCIPIAGKLKMNTQDELTRKEMIVASILSIQNGDNPRIVKQKLLTYVPSEIRSQVADEQEG